ncbi:hypothetical protein RUM44_012515 [Polyplax serrata]|uniref:Protein quiver n=1 Tax=Polyplax serrata TaxID=468196 RepID=A0ABR1BBI1_POLSC
MGSVWLISAIFLLYCHGNVEAVNCYVCSWSPQDRELEADRCSTGNFDERRVRYIDCRVGCEVVKILDSNGELLTFYRNCLMSSPNKFDYERSNKKSTIMTEEEMYACDSDLCNGSFLSKKSSLLLLSLAVLLPFLSSPL